MTEKKQLMYFPTNKDEIEDYVEDILSHTLKDYESEKLLLHSILHMLFVSDIEKDEVCPNTLLYILQMTSVEDEDGFTLLDKLYLSVEGAFENQAIENFYWYFKETDVFVDTVIRLIGIYQFYDKLFDAPVYSEDGKILICYPNHLKEKVYSVADGTEKIASHAFSDNPHIETIKLPKSLCSIGRLGFSNLINLKAFIVNKENKKFYSDAGVLYKNKQNPTLMKYPSGIKNTNVFISEKTKKVITFAFENCYNIKEIAIENSKTILEDAAFFGCKHLDEIVFLDGKTEEVNENAFNGTSLSLLGEDNQNISMPIGDDVLGQPIDESSILQPQHQKGITTLEEKIPSEIKTLFDDYIIGHEEAKKTLAVAVYSHILRCNHKESNIGKSNILLYGPTGCGKTEFARTIAKCLNVPFITIDATSITEAGMKGSDPTDMLKDLIIAANNDIKKAQNGIIYIDEIDKLATFGVNAHRESYSKGVQQSLLKITEGGIVPLRIESPMQQAIINFDTSNILFIVGGAFGNMKKNDNKNETIGFNIGKQTNENAILNTKKLQAKDFVKYGMTQEFMGRFPVIVELKQLTENEIYRIMIEPKNSVIKQYKNLVQCMGAELVFEEDLLKNIAQNAIKTETGARGLRTIIEQLVEDVIFDLPNKKDIKKVVIHKGVLEKEKPKYEN